MTIYNTNISATAPSATGISSNGSVSTANTLASSGYILSTSVGGGGGAGSVVSWGVPNATSVLSTSVLTVTADDVIFKGASLSKVLEQLENRLAILVPDPAKLEQFEALRDLYSQYKMMEILLTENEEKKDK